MKRKRVFDGLEEQDETKRGQDKTETVAVKLREPVRTRPYHMRNFDPEGSVHRTNIPRLLVSLNLLYTLLMILS